MLCEGVAEDWAPRLARQGQGLIQFSSVPNSFLLHHLAQGLAQEESANPCIPYSAVPGPFSLCQSAPLRLDSCEQAGGLLLPALWPSGWGCLGSRYRTQHPPQAPVHRSTCPFLGAWVPGLRWGRWARVVEDLNQDLRLPLLRGDPDL